MGTYQSPNSVNDISAYDPILKQSFYVQGTAATGAINVNATFSPSGTQNTNITQVGGASITLGQKTSANSLPIVIASDQSTLPVSLSAALPTGTNSIGKVGTTSAVVNVGQQTSNTTAVQLSVTSTVPTNGIIVRSLAGNSAKVYIGGSGVTTSTGYELSAGESISFTANLNTLYVVGSNNTDKVCYNVE